MNETERYARELAGKGFATLPPAGWDFASLEDTPLDHGFRLCLTHRTAQFKFGLDATLAVYVQDESWIKLYNSVFDLVYLERLFAQLTTGFAREIHIEPLGLFDSSHTFEQIHGGLLDGMTRVQCANDDLNVLYHRPFDIIRLSRFYDSEIFNLYAIRYR